MVDMFWPMFARSLDDAELEDPYRAHLDAKVGTPFEQREEVKLWLSKLGITESVLLKHSLLRRFGSMCLARRSRPASNWW